MSESPNNISIIVNYDEIVKNIPASGKDKNHYKNCENYVYYSGKEVDGTTITLAKKHQYMFMLEATNDNQSIPVKLKGFKDSDLELVGKTELTRTYLATKEDKKGKDVTIRTDFLDPSGNKCKASWDPKILVDTDPG